MTIDSKSAPRGRDEGVDQVDASECAIGPPALAFECKKYRQFVEHYDLNEIEQHELLNVLWNMVVQFVDMGFGLHPIQKAMDHMLTIEETDARAVLASGHHQHSDRELAEAQNLCPEESEDS